MTNAVETQADRRLSRAFSAFGHTYHDLDTSFNPFRSKSDLIDFTLSNARQFYSSKGPLGSERVKI